MAACRKRVPSLPRLGALTIRSVRITGAGTGTAATVPVVFDDGEEGTFGVVKRQGRWLVDTYKVAKPGATRSARAGQGGAAAARPRQRRRATGG
jgi:hypothetical protein